MSAQVATRLLPVDAIRAGIETLILVPDVPACSNCDESTGVDVHAGQVPEQLMEESEDASRDWAADGVCSGCDQI